MRAPLHATRETRSTVTPAWRATALDASHRSRRRAAEGRSCGGSTAGVLLDLAGLVRALQALAAALDRGDELGQVDLEGVEDLGGVVLGAQADLPLAGSGVLDYLLRRTLGVANELMLCDELGLAPGHLLEDPLGLALGLGQ